MKPIAPPLDRLHHERNIWVATSRPDGRPHLAPVWFVHLEERFWVGTGASSVRVRNLRHHPFASISLEDGDHPIVAECAARIHERDRPGPVVTAFSAKYDWDITVAVDADLGEIVLLELEPLRWLFGADLPTADAATGQ